MESDELYFRVETNLTDNMKFYTHDSLMNIDRTN
jgi:hypothetical protein